MIIEAKSPFRPLDWRWQRAQTLSIRLAADPNAAKAEDEWIRLAASMTHANVNVHDSPMSHGVAAAFEFYRAGGLRSAILQARLLAGESSQAIAAKMGMEPEAIDAYEALLYCVRDRLAARDWIACMVLGMYPWLAESRADKANLMRLHGYFGGPLLVDLWAAYFAGGSLAVYGDDADVRAMLDLLVRIDAQPMEDLSATLRALAEFEGLLKKARKESATGAQTAKNAPLLDLSAAVSVDLCIEPEVVEEAQTKDTSVDAA